MVPVPCRLTSLPRCDVAQVVENLVVRYLAFPLRQFEPRDRVAERPARSFDDPIIGLVHRAVEAIRLIVELLNMRRLVRVQSLVRVWEGREQRLIDLPKLPSARVASPQRR
jgi:hypothetical protein